MIILLQGHQVDVVMSIGIRECRDLLRELESVLGLPRLYPDLAQKAVAIQLNGKRSWLHLQR